MTAGNTYRIKELFHRVAVSDTAAYTELFRQYYGLVYTKALLLCKVPATASDVAQQVFLKLWEKRAILSSIENPEGWLLTLARNQVLDMLKHAANSHKYINYIQELFQQETSSTPEQLLIHQQRQELIRKSLDTLTAKQREAYILNREEGLTFQEIADSWGVSKDTVKEHIAKAVDRIRKYLAAHRDELLLLILVICLEIIIS